jgi:hypothetical protein
VLGLTGHMQRKEQWSRQMPVMRMPVVLGKPCVFHAKLIGQSDQVGNFVKDRRRWLFTWSFKVVGQTDQECAHLCLAVLWRTSSNLRRKQLSLDPSLPANELIMRAVQARAWPG